MIKVTEKEVLIIKNASDRKIAIDEIIDKTLSRSVPLKNKELLHGILDEYVRAARIVNLWWEEMGKEYNFDYLLPHNIDYKTGIITSTG